WGTIMVKDKLPPVIECNDINISCTETNIPNEPAPCTCGVNSASAHRVGTTRSAKPALQCLMYRIILST
ncbi:MAG: hypothetical protein IPG32_05615, partial [Saprospirales bacterium]|nr:hypothetical protein [Saprospirales bacterium]